MPTTKPRTDPYATPDPYADIPADDRRPTTEPPTGFDITAVIGRVELSPLGSKSELHAALEVIADDLVNASIDDPDRTYRFRPSPASQTFVVAVGRES